MTIDDYFSEGLRRASERSAGPRPRVGAELKFPLTTAGGESVGRETVAEFFAFLDGRGWEPIRDPAGGHVVGARRPGPMNDTIAATETGYSKLEFAMAHVGDLDELARAVAELRAELRRFAEARDVRFLGFGIHPVAEPGRHLLQRQERAAVWDRLLVSHDRIPPDRGHDGHLFTINAGSHVHLSLAGQEAVDAVDVLNGFAAAQIALTADSNVWRGRLEEGRQSVSESFWDWWRPAAGRVGVPDRAFGDLAGYVRRVAELPILFVKRDGGPVILDEPIPFRRFVEADNVSGVDLDGGRVAVRPDRSDAGTHNSCYWFNARISRHFTVENRVFDQQAPDELLTPAALTLGLATALPEAKEELGAYDWADLRAARADACREGLAARRGPVEVATLARRMLALAELGLARLGRAEDRFLEPLRRRLRDRLNPAAEAEALYRRGGVAALIEARAL